MRDLIKQFYHIICIVVAIAFATPTVMFMAYYGNISKQYRVLKVANAKAQHRVINIGRDDVGPINFGEPMLMAPATSHIFQSAGSWGDGGYEIQYLQAKSVRNYRAYSILQGVVPKMRHELRDLARGPIVFDIPAYEIGYVDIKTVAAAERDSSRSNPWTVKREFPMAGAPEAGNAILVVSMRLLGDPRSGRSTFSPLRDHFLSEVPPASSPQSEVHDLAEKVLTDRAWWLQIASRAIPGAPKGILEARISQVLQQEQRWYGLVLKVAPGASAAFERGK